MEIMDILSIISAIVCAVMAVLSFNRGQHGWTLTFMILAVLNSAVAFL